jgi:hypothetical protein
MKKMLLILLAVFFVPALIGSLLGHHPSAPTAQAAPAAPPAAPVAAPKPDPETERQALAARGVVYLRSAMRNPDSFHLAQVLEMPKVLCYKYRAGNGFGGMNVEHAVLVGGRLQRESADGPPQAWSKNCAGKTGRDITAPVSQLIELECHGGRC